MNSTRRRWRLVAAIAAGTLSIGLTAACGTGNDGGTSGGGDNTLTVWFPGNSQPEIDLVTKTLVPQFEKENDATVKVTYVDWTQISPKLNAAFAGNTAPDVFGHGPAAAAAFVQADRIEPLDDRVAALPEAEQKDLASYLPGGQVNGKQYLIPLTGQGELIAYRKDLLAAAGVDAPTTWDQAKAAAEKLTTRKGGQIDRAGLLLPSAAIQREQSFATLLGSYGGTLLSADGTKATFNSPAGVAALTYYVSLFSGQGAVSNQLGADFANAPAAQNPLVTGQAAMALLFSSQVVQLVQAEPQLADKIGVLAPLAAQQAKTYGGAGPGLFINKDSQHKDLAWKFIEFMVSKSVSDKYAAVTGGIPVRASAVSGDYVSEHPLLKPFLEAGPAYVPSPNVPAWVQVRDALDKHLEQALAGKVSPKQALDDAAQEADKFLAGQG